MDEMRASGKEYLAPSDVADVLKCNPYTINLTVKKYGMNAYPFPVFPSGNRVKIPRLGFIGWADKAGIE